jgi:hypothetical protein
MWYLFEIHGFHSMIHALDHFRHASCHLPHRDGCLYTRTDGIDAGRQTEEIQAFVLLADGILSIDFGDIGMILLDGLPRGEEGQLPRGFIYTLRCRHRELKRVYLLQLVALGLLIFPSFRGLPVELFRSELQRMSLDVILIAEAGFRQRQ